MRNFQSLILKPVRFILGGALSVFFIVVGMLFSGCSSTDTTTQSTSSHIDSTRTAIQKSATQTQNTLQPSSTKPVVQKPTSSKKPQGFIAKEDTIEAQLVRKTRQGEQSRNHFKAAEKKKYYSVQIGAFRIIANAERCQRLAKKRYNKPVYQFYDRGIKMYRVTVGNFSMRKTAFTFLHAVKKDFPRDYSDAWVAELRR